MKKRTNTQNIIAAVKAEKLLYRLLEYFDNELCWTFQEGVKLSDVDESLAKQLAKLKRKFKSAGGYRYNKRRRK